MYILTHFFQIEADEDADVVLKEDPNSVNGLLAKAEVQYHEGSFERSLKFYYRYRLKIIYLHFFTYKFAERTV